MIAKLAYYGWILSILAGLLAFVFGKGAVILLCIFVGISAAVVGALIFTMYLHDAAKYGTFNHNKWPNQ